MEINSLNKQNTEYQTDSGEESVTNCVTETF